MAGPQTEKDFLRAESKLGRTDNGDQKIEMKEKREGRRGGGGEGERKRRGKKKRREGEREGGRERGS